MKKLLIVIDMQNDFISGSLGTVQAKAIVPSVLAKVESYVEAGYPICFTRDTHKADYLKTQEGQNLPVEHCIEGTVGHEIVGCLRKFEGFVAIVNKPTFGSYILGDVAAEQVCMHHVDEIELVGLCTDICVVSNALLLKARLPEVKVTVDASCCAGVTVETHEAALTTMKMCQVNIINNKNLEVTYV